MLLASIGILGVLALLAPSIHRAIGERSGYLFASAPAALAVWMGVVAAPGVLGGDPVHESFVWVEGLGASAAVRLDGLSLLFSMLVLGVGALVLLYASEYLKGHREIGRFYATLIGFMAAMLGLVLADNIVLLFIFWELTSITSYLLIGFDHEREKARKSALQALLVTGLGGLALLAGLILLAVQAGSWSVSEILANRDAWASGGAITGWTTGLILMGVLTKSASFPFHFWLPGAMEAPTPVSAYLHSSTMVKAGVYLAARLTPAFDEVSFWNDALTLLGGFTLVFAAYLSTRETYFKKVLAYTTVSSLGGMLMLIGLGGEEGAAAACAYLLAHAMFKGALFLVAGCVDHGAHLKDIEKAGGLAKKMPFTAAAGAIAALSMAGLPLTLGFAGKELLLKTSLHAPAWKWYVVISASAAGVFFVVAAWMAGYRAFFAPAQDDSARDHAAHAHENGWRMLLGPLSLASLGVIAALAPWLFAEPMTRAAAGSMLGFEVDAWKSVRLDLGYMLAPGAALMISLGALAVGSVLYFMRGAWRRSTQPLHVAERVGPAQIYHWVYDGVLGFGRFQTRVLQNGSLSVYIKTVVGTLIALTAFAVWRSDVSIKPETVIPDVTGVEWALLLVLLGGAAICATLTSRLAAVAALGAIGYGVAIIFVLYGAPDVAMTQFAVDTLTVIIFVLVIYHLPRFASLSSRRHKSFDLAISTAFGGIMAVLMLIASELTPSRPVSDMIVERAYTEGFGRNVVNVILVDFRALDTLGEITVLGVAAVGVYTLMRLRQPGEGSA